MYSTLAPRPLSPSQGSSAASDVLSQDTRYSFTEPIRAANQNPKLWSLGEATLHMGWGVSREGGRESGGLGW